MVSRSKGRSIIAAAAYRSGKKMTDKETGKTHDYSRKTAVSFSEVFLPEGAPEEYKNSAVLWEVVQKNEKAKDAQLAREFVIALPEELTAKERQELVCDYARKLTEQGMCVDLSIHEKKGNPHAHLLCSTRPLINGKWTLKEKKEYALNANGERIPLLDKNGQQKTDKKGRRQWKRITVQSNPFNAREKLEEWRKLWADMANAKLPEEKSVDHRSYTRQGIDRMSQIHEGYGAHKAERHQRNEEIKKYNFLREKIKKTPFVRSEENINERQCQSFPELGQIPGLDEFRSLEHFSQKPVPQMFLGGMDNFYEFRRDLSVYEIKSDNILEAQQRRDLQVRGVQPPSIEIFIAPFVPLQPIKKQEQKSEPELEKKPEISHHNVEKKGFFDKLFSIFEKKRKEIPKFPEYESSGFIFSPPPIEIKMPKFVPLQKKPKEQELSIGQKYAALVRQQRGNLNLTTPQSSQPERVYISSPASNEALKALNGAAFNVRMRCWSIPKTELKKLGKQAENMRIYASIGDVIKKREISQNDKNQLLGLNGSRRVSKGMER